MKQNYVYQTKVFRENCTQKLIYCRFPKSDIEIPENNKIYNAIVAGADLLYKNSRKQFK